MQMPLVMWFLAMALQVLGLEATSVVPQKSSGSTRLLTRLFETANGKQLGVDVSLLETSFARHKAPLTHKQAKELLDSMGRRVDPKGMRWHVENELLPMAESTSRALQAEIDDAEKALNNCSSLAWNAENAITHRQHILDKDEEKEYECIIEENAAVHEEKELCANVEHLISNTAKSEPAEMKQKRGTSSASSVLAALKEAQEFYTKTFQDTSTANSKCDEARAKADRLHESCQVAEETVEKFYCYMKAGRDAACEDYDKCYNEKLQNLKDVKSHVEKTDTINKEHFTQMACSYWVKDIASTSCESTIADTGHLDISYPEEPMEATCAPVQKFHARREHAHFECKDGDPVKMLDNMFPAENPAPESPATEDLAEAPLAPETLPNETAGGEEMDAPEALPNETAGGEELEEADTEEAPLAPETLPNKTEGGEELDAPEPRPNETAGGEELEEADTEEELEEVDEGDGAEVPAVCGLNGITGTNFFCSQVTPDNCLNRAKIRLNGKWSACVEKDGGCTMAEEQYDCPEKASALLAETKAMES